MAREHIETRAKYYTIIDGTFRIQVDPSDPSAVKRDWQSADGKTSGTKYERIVNAMFGYIEDIAFVDSVYGMQLFIKLDFNEGEAQPVLALNMASREAEDFLKKLPNIDLSKEVKLRPFNFTGNEGDEVRGMEVLQPDESGKFTVKITNYFRDTEAKTNINGFPNPDGDTNAYSKDDWKLYFLQARKFLVTYTKEKICPKFAQPRVKVATTAEARTEADFVPAVEIDPLDEVFNGEPSATDDYDPLHPKL